MVLVLNVFFSLPPSHVNSSLYRKWQVFWLVPIRLQRGFILDLILLNLLTFKLGLLFFIFCKKKKVKP